MVQVEVKVEINRSAEEVWAVIRDFGSLAKWMPGIRSLKLVQSPAGLERQILQDDGETLVERLESVDESARTLTYHFVTSTLPISQHRATLRVHALASDQCQVEWSSSSLPRGISDDQLRTMLENLYERSLYKLRDMLVGKAA